MEAGVFGPYLLPEERVLWRGTPARGVRLVARDFWLVPFSLVWCGFAIFWEFSVVNIPHTPVYFRLWGIPFVLAGLYFVAGRLLLDAWLRGRTEYALTGQRALIYRPAPFGVLMTLNLRQMTPMTLTEGAGGVGTIRFGAAPVAGRPGAAWTPALDAAPQFLAIEDAAGVFRRIQGAISRD
jgi:hypothetical protein